MLNLFKTLITKTWVCMRCSNHIFSVHVNDKVVLEYFADNKNKSCKFSKVLIFYKKNPRFFKKFQKNLQFLKIEKTRKFSVVEKRFSVILNRVFLKKIDDFTQITSKTRNEILNLMVKFWIIKNKKI